MWPFASRKDIREELSQHTNQVRTALASDLQSIQQTLLAEIRNRPPAPTVQPDLRIDMLSEHIIELHDQVQELIMLIQHVTGTHPVTRTVPIQDAIQARINQAILAINALGQEYSSWLTEHHVAHQEVQQLIDTLQHRYQASTHHLLPPPPDEKQHDTEPVTQV